MCNAEIKNKKCRIKPCTLYHPQLCRANSNKKVCKWGEICKFRHTYENTQRNSFWRNENKTPHHNIHHGPPTKNNKHQQSGYGPLEGRHQEGMYRDPWNRGPDRNWEGYNTGRKRHDNFYENYGHNQRSKEYSEHFHMEWPTP